MNLLLHLCMPEASALAKDMALAVQHCEAWVEAARKHAARLYLDGHPTPKECRMTVALTSHSDLDPMGHEVALQCLFGTKLSQKLNCSVLLPAEALQRFAVSEVSGPTSWRHVSKDAFVRVASFATFVSALEGELERIAEAATKVTRDQPMFVQRTPIVLMASNAINERQVVADNNKLSIVLCSAGHTNPRLYSGDGDRYIWVSRVGPFNSESATLFAFERPTMAGAVATAVHISVSSPETGREFHGRYPITFESNATEDRGLLPPGLGGASSFKARRDATIKAIWDCRREFLKQLRLEYAGKAPRVSAAEYGFGSYWPELMEFWPETWDELVFAVENKAIGDGLYACVRVVSFDEVFGLPSSGRLKQNSTPQSVAERLAILTAPMRHRRTIIPATGGRAPYAVLVIKDFGEVERQIVGGRGQAPDELPEASRRNLSSGRPGGQPSRPTVAQLWRRLQEFNSGTMKQDGTGPDAIVLLYSSERMAEAQSQDNADIVSSIGTGGPLRRSALESRPFRPFDKHTRETNMAIAAWYEHIVPLPGSKFAPAEFMLPQVAESTLSAALNRFWDALYSDGAVPPFEQAIDEAHAGLLDGLKKQRQLPRFMEERQRLKDYLVKSELGASDTENADDYCNLFAAISNLIHEESETAGLSEVYLVDKELVEKTGLASVRIKGMLERLEEFGYVQKVKTRHLVLKPICLSAADELEILA